MWGQWTANADKTCLSRNIILPHEKGKKRRKVNKMIKLKTGSCRPLKQQIVPYLTLIPQPKRGKKERKKEAKGRDIQNIYK